MGRPAKSTYLFRRTGWYYFRIAVPDELRPLVGLREIRYSLATCHHRTAKLRSLRLVVFILGLFEKLRQRKMAELNDSEIKKMVREHFKRLLEQDELERLTREDPKTLDDIEKTLFDLGAERQASEWELATGIYGPEVGVDPILAANNLQLSSESLEYRKFCREVSKSNLMFMDICAMRENGDYTQADKLSEQHFEAVPVKNDERSQDSQPPVGKTLPEVVRLYVEDRKTEGKWRPKTEDEFKACLGLLQEHFGDVPLDSITYEMMRDYRETLLKFPKNRLKGKHKGKSIAEIRSMDIPPNEAMSLSSVNKYLSRTSSLFNYAVRRDFMRKNPAVGMEIQQEKRDHELRDRFTSEDLRKIFDSKEYREDTHRSSYCFWLPVLGLYTGCRLDELCQLHLSDVREVSGVWVLDINDGDEKKVKSKAGKRLVPLHPFLLNELKLPAYVRRLQDQGHKRLFPELALRRDGYGQTASKWFQRYRARCGVVEEGKVYHSFRHSFDNALKQALVPDTIISEVMGHTEGSLAMGRYSDPFRPGIVLEQAIMKLDFGIDLSHLAKSQFVVKPL